MAKATETTSQPETTEPETTSEPPSFLDSIIETHKHERPRRILLYGTQGIGKSTFGAMAPASIFIPTEDGLGDIKAKAFPICQSYRDIENCITALGGKHDFQTVVLDSADWAEQLIWKKLCDEGSKSSIVEFGFGKGYGLAATIFREMLDGFAWLNTEKNMRVIMLAHSKIERFSNPAGDDYDRYTPRLHKDVAGLVQEWCDEVLFATEKVYIKKPDDKGKAAATKGKGVSSGKRIIYTTEKASHMAKNRLGLPDELELDWREYEAAFNSARDEFLKSVPF